MPMPLSLTRKVRCSALVIDGRTQPDLSAFGWVYFTALFRRLQRTCSSCAGSASRSTGGARAVGVRPSARALGRGPGAGRSRRHGRATWPVTSSRRSMILPRVIRETSSRSSTRWVMWRTCRLNDLDRPVEIGLAPVLAWCPWRSTWRALSMGASGLRSSWASMARNSFFWRSASGELLGPLPELAFQPPPLLDVVEDQDDAADRGTVVTDRGGRVVDGDLGSAAGNQHALVAPDPRFPPRRTLATGLSIGRRVSSSMRAKTASSGRPRASSSVQPVSVSAIGFMNMTAPGWCR